MLHDDNFTPSAADIPAPLEVSINNLNKKLTTDPLTKLNNDAISKA